jgi:cytoskeletal protein CcmA (bactofilin family)
MSYGGAAIQLPNADIDCPETFDLQLQSGSTLRCQVRWRNGDRIGVQGETQWPEEVVTDLLNQVDPAAEAPALPAPEPVCQAEAAAQVGQEPEAAPPPQRECPAPVPPQDAPASNRQFSTAEMQPEEDFADDPQVFAVDRGIRLVAETCECAELVIEGYLEATARAQSLRVGPDGRFVGAAEVVVAEIHGRVEGDLTVTGKLVIHPTGTVSGTTRYRQIAIEGGGRILGEVRIMSQGPMAVPEDQQDPCQAAPAA